VLAVGLCGSAAAQGTVPVTRNIAVSGHGEAAGRPDQARISAGVQIRASTVSEASRENQAIVERIMQALRQQGIESKDIQTANYSIWPEQHHDPRGTGEVATIGYNVSNIVNVTVNDIGTVSDVLAAVTNAGANSIQGVNFGVKDTAALEERARAAAMADAREQAEALATLAGVELGEVLTISLSSGGGFPVPMMGEARLAMSAAAPAPDISAGQVNVSVQVQVTYAIR
jgi:hypothetical protein